MAQEGTSSAVSSLVTRTGHLPKRHKTPGERIALERLWLVLLRLLHSPDRQNATRIRLQAEPIGFVPAWTLQNKKTRRDTLQPLESTIKATAAGWRRTPFFHRRVVEDLSSRLRRRRQRRSCSVFYTISPSRRSSQPGVEFSISHLPVLPGQQLWCR